MLRCRWEWSVYGNRLIAWMRYCLSAISASVFHRLPAFRKKPGNHDYGFISPVRVLVECLESWHVPSAFLPSFVALTLLLLLWSICKIKVLEALFYFIFLTKRCYIIAFNSNNNNLHWFSGSAHLSPCKGEFHFIPSRICLAKQETVANGTAGRVSTPSMLRLCAPCWLYGDA